VRANLLSLLKDKISTQLKKSVMQVALTRSLCQRACFIILPGYFLLVTVRRYGPFL